MAARTLSSLLALIAWTALFTVLIDSAIGQNTPPAAPVKVIAIAALNRMLKDVDAAFEAKEYATAVTKLDELIKALPPQTLKDPKDEMMEDLIYKIGLANLLAGQFAEAERAFTEYVTKYPAGMYASRCALGVGKACMGQDTPTKKDLAIKLFKMAMKDPRLNAEAGLALAGLYSEGGKRKEAMEVFKALMGSDIRSANQTAAAVGVINLLADEGKLEDLTYYLDHLTNQAGVRDAIAWYTNQVIVKGDECLDSRDFDTALAIFQTAPARSQILSTQTKSLDIQRKNLAILERTIAREDAEEKRKPEAPIVRSVARELASNLRPAIEANEKALAAIKELKDLDAGLLMRRGHCFYELKRYEEARLCFSTLRLKFPTYKAIKTAAFTEIMIMQDLAKSTELLDLCKSYLATYPDSSDVELVATLAGELLVKQAKWPEVATYFADLETRFPKSANLDSFLFYQGLAYFLSAGDTADFARSTPLLEKVTQDYPNSKLYEAALYHLAMTYFLSNDYKKTLGACSAYLSKFPKGLYAGDMQYRLSFVDSNDPRVKPDKIITELEAFMTDHPTDVSNGSMLCLLADTYKKNNQEDSALEAFIKAARSKSPDDVIQYAMDSATTILQTKKDWSTIAEMHGAFLKEHPDSQLAPLSAGKIVQMYNRLGKSEEGAQILAEALRTSISNPAVEQAEYLLDLLVQTLVPRKRPVKDEMEATAEKLEKQLLETLAKAIDKPNPTATARTFYAQARLSQLLYHASRTDHSDLLLKGIATNYSSEPAVLSPTLLSVCGDILLLDGKLDAAQAMYQRLNDRYKDSLFSDAGPLGLGNVALARKQPDAALKIFEDTLVNNKGTSRYCETTIGKLRALIDLGQFAEARKLAELVVSDKTYRGEMAGKAYLMMADSYRIEAARPEAVTERDELMRKAYNTYQRMYVVYQSLPDICAEAYWQASETAKALKEGDLAAENLKVLANHPKLQNTKRAKEAKDKSL
ncbi:MAG: tetratricopeptide repeat protein [Verrucomicrobia bacterium]|nr:MAG: tetratricopeptide repeat protein [Verrucomicrobiota bacterium]